MAADEIVNPLVAAERKKNRETSPARITGWKQILSVEYCDRVKKPLLTMTATLTTQANGSSPEEVVDAHGNVVKWRDGVRDSTSPNQR